MIIKRERSPLAIILLAVLLVVIACVSLTFGQIDVPVSKALAVIGSQLNLPGALRRLITAGSSLPLSGISACRVCW